MIYGFIGAGTITEAIVTGMMASPLPIAKVVLSPRNAEIARSLADRFDGVEVAASNQAVVDASDVLVLAVRLQVAEEVLRNLSIPEGKKIVSVVAATSHEKLAAWTGRPADTIVRAIPLPFVAERDGVTAVYPPDAEAEKLFNALGKAVACATKHEFDLLAAASSTMGTYFGILERMTEWLVDQGMDEGKARSYLTPLFGSLAHVASRSSETRFAQLRQEFSTRGGLNEQVFSDFESGGGSIALSQALDRVLERIKR